MLLESVAWLPESAALRCARPNYRRARGQLHREDMGLGVEVKLPRAHSNAHTAQLTTTDKILKNRNLV